MNKVFPKHKEALNEILSGLDMNKREILIEQLKKLGFHAQMHKACNFFNTCISV